MGTLSCSEGKGHTFASCRGRHLFAYRTGHAQTCRFCARSCDERAQEHAFQPHDAQFFLIDFDPLGERAEVIAAVAATIDPHSLAGCPGDLERLSCNKPLHRHTTDRGAPCALYPAIKRSVVYASPVLRYPSPNRHRTKIRTSRTRAGSARIWRS